MCSQIVITPTIPRLVNKMSSCESPISQSASKINLGFMKIKIGTHIGESEPLEKINSKH